ncbi:cGMP-specific 3',5'-cyclic phosphodiesterase [Trichonephila clavipes]|nr:cGMP-specific 3',5'-cyclic phosphodiesterase [Trichonephila clavipes]
MLSSHRSRKELQQHLKSLKEPDLLMELIRDIANELDVDTLCHKILVNVGILTNSDRGSLFLAKGPRGSRYLVAKLFDVTPDSVLQDALDAAVDEEGESRIPSIPFGVGIAGHVALTKENVNIKDAYQVRCILS